MPLEAIPALMGAALATGTLWDESVAAWGVVGILYHLAGYGHNSLADWIKGHDRDDPNKQHHPLNAGTISPKRAKWFVWMLMACTAVLTTALAAGSILAITGVGLALIGGLIYNYFGKRTEFKFIYISIAHSMMFAIPFFALGGDVTSGAFQFGMIYMFLWIAFQISVSGEIKDIAQDDSNFIRDLGTDFTMRHASRRGPTIEFSTYVKQYAYSLKLLTVITSMLIAIWLKSLPRVYLLIIPISLAMFATSVQLLKNGGWNRRTRIANMSLIEMFTAYLFIVSFTNVIGILSVAALIFSSTLWVIIGNKLLWGTFVAPEV